jgi:hypothetical protein
MPARLGGGSDEARVAMLGIAECDLIHAILREHEQQLIFRR